MEVLTYEHQTQVSFDFGPVQNTASQEDTVGLRGLKFERTRPNILFINLFNYNFSGAKCTPSKIN